MMTDGMVDTSVDLPSFFTIQENDTMTIRTTLALTAGALLLTMTSAITVAHARSARAYPGANMTTTLTRITETRVHEFVEDDDAFSTDTSGVHLTFRANTPDGDQLLGVEQDGHVVATDNTGVDLTALDTQWSSSPMFVEEVMAWEGPMTSFIVHLSPASRAARSFDLRIPLKASIYRDLKTFTLPIGTSWTSVESRIFEMSDVKVRLVRSGDQVRVEFMPGNVYDLIESTTLIGSDEYESNAAMWGDDGATLYFENAAGKDGAIDEVRLEVRSGYRQETFEITLKNQPLP